jgi:hypothetical protein
MSSQTLWEKEKKNKQEKRGENNSNSGTFLMMEVVP